MDRSKRPVARDHVAERAVIDYLTKRVFTQSVVKTGRQFDEVHGRAVQDAIGKRWTPTQGGLPEF
jgi:hypothetical protein